MSAENFAKGERRDVAHCRGKDNERDESVSVARVRQKSEMPEHPADIDESDDGERHSLQLTAAAIAQDRNDQDESDQEISTKDGIVQRDLRQHHCLSCSATVIRFKRTTIV